MPSQHPVHVSGSHTHEPETHVWPVVHAKPTPHTHWPVAAQVFVRVVTHDEQALPPVPQVVVVEGRQVSPSQQPVGQVAALQLAVATHTPPSAEQVEPAPHAAQLRPPTPQAVVLVPVWQTPETQQPEQFAGPHGSMHAWLEHVVAQLEQATPPLPHASALVPLRHTPPWQHPVGQVVESQLPLHEPPSQLPTPHASHAAPPAPQVRFDCAVTQVAPTQHPPGQVVALQAEETHCPPLHAVPPQSAQARPPTPHVVGDWVITHWFPRQHPPGHDDGVHWQVCERHSWPALQLAPLPQRHCPPSQRSAPNAGLHAGPLPHPQRPAVQESANKASHARHAPPVGPHAATLRAVTHSPAASRQPLHWVASSLMATSRSKPRSTVNCPRPSPTRAPPESPTTSMASDCPASASLSRMRTVVVGPSTGPPAFGGRSTGSKTRPPSTLAS